MRINMVNFFGSNQIKSVQNGSSWVSFSRFSTFSTFSKFFHFSTFYKFFIINLFALDNNKNGNLFLIRFDQICPNWIKLDQIWISHLSKKCYYKTCHVYRENKLIKHGQLFWIKSDQNGSKLIKFVFLAHRSQPTGPSPRIPAIYSSLSRT